MNFVGLPVGTYQEGYFGPDGTPAGSFTTPGLVSYTYVQTWNGSSWDTSTGNSRSIRRANIMVYMAGASDSSSPPGSGLLSQTYTYLTVGGP
jgi:hypothetical protein